MMRIDLERLRTLLADEPFIRRIELTEETPSTNLLAKELARQGAQSGTLVIAQKQTAGRGRRGRSWESGEGTSLAMSILLRPGFSAEKASRITQAAALGMCRTLRHFGADAKIKWPNDILVNGRKLVGILSEFGMEGEKLSYIVCGIGVNVGQRGFSGELSEIAGSLYTETGVLVPREAVAAHAVKALAPLFCACEEDAAYKKLLSDYRQNCLTLGQSVKVIGTDAVRYGTAVDTDEEGRLLLRQEDGSLFTVHAGDVSIRPVSNGAV